ncbi:unnamed protein product [Cylindrotheca closterium]|uniref:Uncharacterized protein n=1 Tax=Cylindrotheca closterium TaxID=2856 RepID=A0AAD2CMW6_9STRA|nr:unnamed protein product [Cylindrotheca closterium]
MKFCYLDHLFGNHTVSSKGNDPGVVNLASKEPPACSSNHSLNPFDGFDKAAVTSLFRKQKPPDYRHPCHQPAEIRAVEASLKRGEKKISKLEGQINMLESDKRSLHYKVSDQTKVIAKLTKTVSDQAKEISELNKTILSQKDLLEEINTKGEATKNILQWYNQTNDNLCKRLVDTNNELQTLKKLVGQNTI